MKKIRLFLATIALIVTLGGLSLTGMGAGTLANAATHVSAVHASSLVYRHYGPCPYGSDDDC
ncbi:MAG TPA: hypothetical protein DHW02_14655 [Ktedonobacter sp.]|nr:hypothetical protein [Ktedonobacter sp.]